MFCIIVSSLFTMPWKQGTKNVMTLYRKNSNSHTHGKKYCRTIVNAIVKSRVILVELGRCLRNLLNLTKHYNVHFLIAYQGPCFDQSQLKSNCDTFGLEWKERVGEVLEKQLMRCKPCSFLFKMYLYPGLSQFSILKIEIWSINLYWLLQFLSLF